jgi:AcrR family transcriptional regulator
MPRVKPEYKAERRAQIVEAARACFARDGFHRTTLQNVFAEAALSAGAVYNYFQSKDELILAIAEDRHRDEALALSQRASSLDPLDTLRQVGNLFIDTYLSAAGDEKRRIAVQTWSEAMLNNEILSSVREGLAKPLHEIVALIRRAQKSGQLDAALDPATVARSLIALLHGFMLQKLWDAKLDIDLCTQMFERFLTAFQAADQSKKRRR